MQVQSLGWGDPLEKEMATHSGTIAWKIPWMEEPSRLQSMGSQRVGHDWVSSLTSAAQLPLLPGVDQMSFPGFPWNSSSTHTPAKSSVSSSSFVDVLSLPCSDQSPGLHWGHRSPWNPLKWWLLPTSLLIPLGLEVKWVTSLLLPALSRSFILLPYSTPSALSLMSLVHAIRQSSPNLYCMPPFWICWLLAPSLSPTSLLQFSVASVST